MTDTGKPDILCTNGLRNGSLINHNNGNECPIPPVNGSKNGELRNLHLMRVTDQVKELQTVIRDKESSRSDFIFYADRLIRLVVEEGLNLLPYEECTITTPSGQPYDGVRYMRGNCGVSIMRSGESMEQGLRDCCRSIRIGKILIQNEENNQARLYYAKLPPDVACRKVLVLYPVLSAAAVIRCAMDVLREHEVPEENVILLTLFCSPEAVDELRIHCPRLRIVTSEVHPVPPIHFGSKYFGTD